MRSNEQIYASILDLHNMVCAGIKTTAEERAEAYHHNKGFVPDHMLPHLDNPRKRKQAQVREWLREK